MINKTTGHECCGINGKVHPHHVKFNVENSGTDRNTLLLAGLKPTANSRPEEMSGIDRDALLRQKLVLLEQYRHLTEQLVETLNLTNGEEAEHIEKAGRILESRQALIEEIDALDHHLDRNGGNSPALEGRIRPLLEEIQTLESKSRESLECRYRELKNKITRLQAGRRALQYMKVMDDGAVGKLDASR